MSTASSSLTQVAAERINTLYTCVKEHVSVNKLIGALFSIHITRHLHATYAHGNKSIGTTRIRIMAAVFALQALVAKQCETMRPGTTLAHRAFSLEKRQSALILSFFVKLDASTYAYQLLQKKVLKNLSLLPRTVLTAVFATGMALLNKKAFDAEKGLMSRAMVESERVAQEALTTRTTQVQSFFLGPLGEEQTATLMEHFITGEMEGPTLTFQGFGHTFILREDGDVAPFITDITNCVNQHTDHDLIDLDAVWIKEADATQYAAVKVRFDAFAAHYDAASDEQREIMATFAKIYPFKVAAGDIESMKTFIHNYNKAELKRQYPGLTTQIDAIFSAQAAHHLQSINITSRIVNTLIESVKTTLQTSLQKRELLPQCQEQINLLRQIIRPLDTRSRNFLNTLNKITNYASAQEHGSTLLELPMLFITPDHSEGTLEWTHAYRTPPTSEPDQNVRNSITNLANDIAMANQVMRLEGTHPILQSIREAIVDSMKTRTEKCKQTSKKVGLATTGIVATGLAVFTLPTAALVVGGLGAAYLARKTITSNIQAQIREATDTGKNGIEQAIETGIAQFKGFANGYSFAAHKERLEQALRREATDFKARVIGIFTPTQTTQSN